MKKSIVLLSSGLDSTVNLAMAKKHTKVILALTFDYGQASSKKEILNSKKLCKFFKVKYKIIKLDFYKGLIKDKKIPTIKLKDLNNIKLTKKTAQKIWFPNRNALFINIAAAFAEKLKADIIIAGFNKEEAKTFPDNSKEFVNCINRTLKYSALSGIIAKSYTQDLTKKEIVKLGIKLNAPFKYIWPCYKGGKKPCGACESCVRYLRALKEN
ncbi:MAG: 7-cyano-7-deazaguanine synthase QueC [Armatimonadota bacterium]